MLYAFLASDVSYSVARPGRRFEGKLVKIRVPLRSLGEGLRPSCLGGGLETWPNSGFGIWLDQQLSELAHIAYQFKMPDHLDQLANPATIQHVAGKPAEFLFQSFLIPALLWVVDVALDHP